MSRLGEIPRVGPQAGWSPCVRTYMFPPIEPEAPPRGEAPPEAARPAPEGLPGRPQGPERHA